MLNYECKLCALGIGGGLIPQCLRPAILLRQGVVLVQHAGFDGVKETAEPLVGFRGPPVKLGQMLAATLGALPSTVDDAGKEASQSLEVEQAIPDMIGDKDGVDLRQPQRPPSRLGWRPFSNASATTQCNPEYCRKATVIEFPCPIA